MYKPVVHVQPSHRLMMHKHVQENNFKINNRQNNLVKHDVELVSLLLVNMGYGY